MSKHIILSFLTLYMLSNKNLFCQGYFKNSTKPLQINHTHVAPNLMGGGIAIIDFDNDGFEDLYFTGGVYQDRLYRNNGDKTFTEMNEFSEIFEATRTVHTTGVISGDINNDGYDDLFISTEQGEKNILFLNQNGKSFINIARQAGITSQSWSMGASFGDYNIDGYLDIYVINYVKKPRVVLDEKNEVIGFNHECYPNKLYLNNGDNTFTEVAKELNIANTGCGLAVAFSDVNGDSYPDVYVANDFGEWIAPNAFFQNNYPDNGFSDNSQSANLDIKIYGMGIGIGDVNNDGRLDYYVTNLGKNALMVQKESGYFDDNTDLGGVANQKVDEYNSTGWGTEIFDYDHDGFEDIFVSNGYIGAAPFLNTTQKDPHKLYKNNGDGSFTDVSEMEKLDDISIGRGVVTFDFDNDGDLDIVTSNISSVKQDSSGIQIFENKKGNEKKWLKVKLKGEDSNISGIGSRVICYYQGKIWVDEISGGSSHASKKSNFAHFGLNDIAVLDSVIVIWAGGHSQSAKQVKTNQFILFEEYSGEVSIIGCMDQSNPYFNANATLNKGCLVSNNVIAAISDENGNLPYEIYPNPVQTKFYIKKDKKEILTVKIFDLNGQEIYAQKVRSQQQIDVSNLTNGIYLLNIDEYFYHKISIKK